MSPLMADPAATGTSSGKRRLQVTTALTGQQAPERVALRLGGRRRTSAKLPAARFLLPAIVLYGLVFVVPFIGSLPLSFSSWNGIGRFTFDGLSNFAHVVTNALVPGRPPAQRHNGRARSSSSPTRSGSVWPSC